MGVRDLALLKDSFAELGLVNTNADIRGRLGFGVPLNQFGSIYTPFIGQNATELYGLPFRSFLPTYWYKAR